MKILSQKEAKKLPSYFEGYNHYGYTDKLGKKYEIFQFHCTINFEIIF